MVTSKYNQHIILQHGSLQNNTNTSFTARGRVTDFADVLDIGSSVVMKTLAGEAVIGQSEHVTTRNGRK